MAAKERFNTDMIRLNALKLFMDGVSSTYTASMLKAYEGTTDVGPDPYYTAEIMLGIMQLKQVTLAWLFISIPVVTGANLGEALDGYQMAKEAGIELDPRFSLEHWTSTHPNDIPRA